ncbi:hypothetical protein GGX14DRAFT_558580 [Mycena pura]|uniref:Uncharacterized protein n=1 Tax=Mycena pura TaxID=153505 RepID=A0AAD6YL52_9AGAR|nr:hypothetical protein GGX14DRAFT_558580 [Mycena pura]
MKANVEVPRQWIIPDSVPLALRQAWLESEKEPQEPRFLRVIPCATTSDELSFFNLRERNRKQPDETEAVPPIPAHLRDRECLYGYVVTDALLDAFRVSRAPDQHTPNSLRLAHNHVAVLDLAESMGLQRVYLEYTRGRDIIWFSYTKGGVVRIEEVPIAPRLERFSKELGITEKAQWLDAGLPAQKVRGNLPVLAALF